MSYIYQNDLPDLDFDYNQFKSIILNIIKNNYANPQEILELIEYVEKNSNRHIYDSHPFAIFCINIDKIRNIIIQKSVTITFEYELDFNIDITISDSDIANFIKFILKDHTYNIKSHNKKFDICSYCNKDLQFDIVDLYCGDSYHLNCLSENMNYDCICPKCSKSSFLNFIEEWYDIEYHKWNFNTVRENPKKPSNYVAGFFRIFSSRYCSEKPGNFR